MKILFKYCTRSRRALFLRGIESIVNNLSNKEDYHILISVESELKDPAMHPLPVLDCNHTYIVGNSKNKVDAYNRDINEFNYDWDILVCMSDDMVFIKKGFDDAIRELFFIREEKSVEFVFGRNDLDKLIHFPDGNRNDLITMPIMGRTYYDRTKYVYHPSYVSVYCDNEQMDVARLLGCYVFANYNIFEHRHPAYGKGKMDELYIENDKYYQQDNNNYLKRKDASFGINTNTTK